MSPPDDEISLTGSLRAAITSLAPELGNWRTAFVVSRGEAILVRVGSSVLVKYGPQVRSVEADTLRFVSENTSIPVPAVKGVYASDDGVTYIVMEYVHGDNLLHVWNTLSSPQKEEIITFLRTTLKDLRLLTQNYIGALGRKPCRDVIFEECEQSGPFDSEEEMNETIVRSSKCGWMPTEGFVKSTLSGLPSNHSVVFCHGELTPEHIIIDKDRKTVKAVVGWSCAGFFPEYWEFLNALTVQDWNSDWVVYVQKILDPYYEEYALWYRLREMAYGL